MWNEISGTKLQLPPEPLTRGLPPPDPRFLWPLSSTEFVEPPPEQNSWVRHWWRQKILPHKADNTVYTKNVNQSRSSILLPQCWRQNTQKMQEEDSFNNNIPAYQASDWWDNTRVSQMKTLNIYFYFLSWTIWCARTVLPVASRYTDWATGPT